MRVMFTAVLGGFMDHQFGLDVKRALLKPMVEGSIEVYLRISQELLPTPARAHYTFNLRDLSKVFQGILMIKSRQVSCSFLCFSWFLFFEPSFSCTCASTESCCPRLPGRTVSST